MSGYKLNSLICNDSPFYYNKFGQESQAASPAFLRLMPKLQ